MGFGSVAVAVAVMMVAIGFEIENCTHGWADFRHVDIRINDGWLQVGH